jgi:hypothetical protein
MRAAGLMLVTEPMSMPAGDKPLLGVGDGVARLNAALPILLKCERPNVRVTVYIACAIEYRLVRSRGCCHKQFCDVECAVALYRRHAGGGNSLVTDQENEIRLLVIAMDSIGAVKKRREALETLYRTWQTLPSSTAMYRIGWCHATGSLGKKRRRNLAREWFTRAAAKGHAGAASHLAQSPELPCHFSPYDLPVILSVLLPAVRQTRVLRGCPLPGVELGLLFGGEFRWAEVPL